MITHPHTPDTNPATTRRVLLAAFGVLACCSFFAFSGEAFARPEMAGHNVEARFKAMDTNTDGKVSREEFFTAQPQMKEAAFAAIDTNGDGDISMEEWNAFADGHSKGEAQPGEPHGADPHEGHDDENGPAKKTRLIMPGEDAK